MKRSLLLLPGSKPFGQPGPKVWLRLEKGHCGRDDPDQDTAGLALQASTGCQVTLFPGGERREAVPMAIPPGQLFPAMPIQGPPWHFGLRLPSAHPERRLHPHVSHYSNNIKAIESPCLVSHPDKPLPCTGPISPQRHKATESRIVWGRTEEDTRQPPMKQRLTFADGFRGSLSFVCRAKVNICGENTAFSWQGFSI